MASPRDFSWVADTPAVYSSSPGCERTFCAVCGTKLTFTDMKRPGDVDITTGSLDDPGGVAVEEQIFGLSKVAWVRIDPHVPFQPAGVMVERPIEPLGDTETLEGGCLCGAVRYGVVGMPTTGATCYCSICRRLTGGFFAAWGSWPRDRFREISGSTTAYPSSPAGMRRFCPTCGATVYFEVHANPGVAELMLAGLDQPDRVPPPMHEFVADAVRGLVIDDDLPRWPGRPGAAS